MLALVLQAIAVSAAMWRAPWTFPLSSALWWQSTGFVLAAWGLVAIATWAASRARAEVLTAAMLVPTGLLLAVGISGRLLFTATSGRFWGGIAGLGLLWALALSRTIRGFEGWNRGFVLLGVLAGAPWGVAWSIARIPAPAGTHPAGGRLAPAGEEGVVTSGTLRVPCRGATLVVRPVLTFKDSSADGFWPGLVASPYAVDPALEGDQRSASVRVVEDGGVTSIDVVRNLRGPVHSHLNSYTDLVIEGARQPGVQFPAAAGTFELLPFDYPKGRPARFAYLSAQEQLVVAQAADAEKGPFRTLSSGALKRGAPLDVVITDGALPLCRVSFLDFTAQADVTSSPTAGDGVPTNVVQFGVPMFPVEGKPWLHLSLAESGIGAGRDAVTHAAGVYRNRVVISPP